MDVPGGGRKRALEFACVARGYSNDAEVNVALNILAPQGVERARAFSEASRGMWTTPARVARRGESRMQVPMYGSMEWPRSMDRILS